MWIPTWLKNGVLVELQLWYCSTIWNHIPTQLPDSRPVSISFFLAFIEKKNMLDVISKGQHRWSKHVPRVQRLNLECILSKAVLRVQCWAEMSNDTTPVDSFAQINSVVSPCFVAEAPVRVVYFGHELHSNSTSPSWVLPGITGGFTSNCTEARGEGHVGGRGLAVPQPRSTLRMDCTWATSSHVRHYGQPSRDHQMRRQPPDFFL